MHQLKLNRLRRWTILMVCAFLAPSINQTADARPVKFAQTRYLPPTPDIVVDKIIGGKMFDKWANLYRTGHLAEAEKVWIEMIKPIKDYDSMIEVQKVAHMRLILGGEEDDKTEYNALNLDMHILKASQKALGPEHPAIADALEYIDMSYRSSGNYQAARPYAERALALRRKTLAPGNPHIARAEIDVANFFIRDGKYAQAKQLLDQAIVVFQNERWYKDIRECQALYRKIAEAKRATPQAAPRAPKTQNVGKRPN